MEASRAHSELWEQRNARTRVSQAASTQRVPERYKFAVRCALSTVDNAVSRFTAKTTWIRVMRGFHPMTGSRRDGVTSRRHNRPPIASRITSEASFVGADSIIRRSPEYHAAREVALISSRTTRVRAQKCRRILCSELALRTVLSANRFVCRLRFSLFFTLRFSELQMFWRHPNAPSSVPIFDPRGITDKTLLRQLFEQFVGFTHPQFRDGMHGYNFIRPKRGVIGPMVL